MQPLESTDLLLHRPLLDARWRFLGLSSFDLWVRSLTPTLLGYLRCHFSQDMIG